MFVVEGVQGVDVEGEAVGVGGEENSFSKEVYFALFDNPLFFDKILKGRTRDR